VLYMASHFGKEIKTNFLFVRIVLIPASYPQEGLVLTGSEDGMLHMWRPADQSHTKPVDRKKVICDTSSARLH
jgi:hypothetical protein